MANFNVFFMGFNSILRGGGSALLQPVVKPPKTILSYGCLVNLVNQRKTPIKLPRSHAEYGTKYVNQHEDLDQYDPYIISTDSESEIRKMLVTAIQQIWCNYFINCLCYYVKAADDDAGKLQSVFLKRLYLLHICIFSFFLFNASLTTIQRY